MNIKWVLHNSIFPLRFSRRRFRKIQKGRKNHRLRMIRAPGATLWQLSSEGHISMETHKLQFFYVGRVCDIDKLHRNSRYCAWKQIKIKFWILKVVDEVISPIHIHRVLRVKIWFIFRIWIVNFKVLIKR
jgi:hypothetical protein